MIPITANVIQVLFFATPIVWRADMLGQSGWIAEFNPVYHVIECVRRPLLGEGFPAESWLVSLGLLLVGTYAAARMVHRYSHRVAYWV